MSKLIRSLALIFALFVSFAHAELSIHFLDVGQGDAALVICDGESMLIDGGPAAASQRLYTCLRQTVSELDVIVATHPHDDHIGGLAAALNAVPVGVIYSPVTSWDTAAWQNLVRYADAQGTPVIVPGEGDVITVGGADVTILHCWPDAWTENDMSIVLRIDYGATSFLFTGDAEEISERMMLSSPNSLHADVLKVAHHGSRWSSSPEFLEAVKPAWAVISCGRENPYGHPHEEALTALGNTEILRTDQLGDIIFYSDGTDLSYACSDFPLFEARYIGNRNSLRFHYPGCDSVSDMAEKNRVPLASREDAIALGYQPCSRCAP